MYTFIIMQWFILWQNIWCFGIQVVFNIFQTEISLNIYANNACSLEYVAGDGRSIFKGISEITWAWHGVPSSQCQYLGIEHEIDRLLFFFYLKGFFILHTNESSPSLPASCSLPTFLSTTQKGQVFSWWVYNVLHIKLRHDQGPPNCIKAEQGILP